MKLKFYLCVFLIVVGIIFFFLYKSLTTKIPTPEVKLSPETLIPPPQNSISKPTPKEKESISEEYENFLLGKFSPSVNKNLLYLQDKTYSAFLEMREEALKNGIVLNIVSATRNFTDQKNIWNNKWEGITLVAGENLEKTVPDELERFKTILNYSSAPGTSRHHWGTDIDINSVNPSYFDTQKGNTEYVWLVKNAGKFGFCQTYTVKDENRKTGYNEEKWHWSYLPLSQKFLEDYKNNITIEKIKGFDGDKYVPLLNLINDYVLSINPKCL